jgi:RNA polymerase sigma-70 factor, ECF subfamily
MVNPRLGWPRTFSFSRSPGALPAITDSPVSYKQPADLALAGRIPRVLPSNATARWANCIPYVQNVAMNGSNVMTHGSGLPLDAPTAEQQRFLSLFLRSEKEIFRYVAALVPNISDAEDIVQQTALSLWEKFDAYDPAQPFTPWACRFALNKARQWIERRQRWQALLERGLAEELARRREELRPELELRLRHLETCLGKLPEDQRSLVEGYYHRRTGIEKLAGDSGRTVAATYKALQRIRHVLQLCIESATGSKGVV